VLADLATAKVSAKVKAMATQQAQRSIAANKRLESEPKASKELAFALAYICISGMQAAEHIMKGGRTAPKPV
jgi:hypothetical protein